MPAKGGARRGNPLSAPPCCHRRGGLFRPPSTEPVDRPPFRAYQGLIGVIRSTTGTQKQCRRLAAGH
jgi:hypothetical protein